MPDEHNVRSGGNPLPDPPTDSKDGNFRYSKNHATGSVVGPRTCPWGVPGDQ